MDAVLSVVPEKDDKKMGQRRESYAAYKALKIPEWIEMGVKKGAQESCMKAVGRFLKQVIREYVHRRAFFGIHAHCKLSLGIQLRSGYSLQMS